jgi:hypothetical protein
VIAAPDAAPVSVTDRILAFLLLVGCWLWMSRAHLENVDVARAEAKARLHGLVLEKAAPDPYQYKLFAIAHALEVVKNRTEAPLEDVFYGNTIASLAFLVLLHHLWLRSVAPRGTALFGGVLLAALANVLFLDYFHHPHEFWGVGLFCLLLAGIRRGWDWKGLAVLGLVTGALWEKHALLPVVWGLHRLGKGDKVLVTAARGIVFLAACLAFPLAIRHYLGSDRSHVDGDTPLEAQDWGKVLWFQGAFLLPFAAMFLLRFRRIPGLVRLLWLYLPALVAAYASQSFILHEVRSFWALVPVFTATACAVTAHVGPRPAPAAVVPT